MNDDENWELIDAALIRMRRFLEAPREAGGDVDLSAVLVVDTIARRRSVLASTRIVDVANGLSVKPSTASRLVGSAEAAGYVARSPSREDPRSVVLDLTPAGEELNATAKQFRIGLLRRNAPGWNAETVASFARLLDEFSRLGQGHRDARVVGDGPHPREVDYPR